MQTASYLPYFISTVIVAGMVLSFLDTNGLVNTVRKMMGLSVKAFNMDPKAFPAIYTVTNVWKSFGWDSILYLSAMSSIDMNLYEAAKMEGCSSWESFWKITLPMISPMILVNIISSIVDCFTRYDNNVMNSIQSMITLTDYGHASAAAWIYFCAIALLVLIIFGIASRFVFYQGKER